MPTATWTPRGLGSAEPIPTDRHPGLTRLVADGTNTYRTFDGTGTVGNEVDFAVRASDFFGVYIETTTNRGRRQFKIVPRSTWPEFLFGYRYEVGIGTQTRRTGERIYRRSIDLAFIAQILEPGTTITSIDKVFARTRSQLDIEVEVVNAPPPPPPPTGDITRSAAVRFLTQSSFGATEATVAELMAMGSYDAWIDDQVALPISRTEAEVRSRSNGSLGTTRHYVWFNNAVEEPDQLRQRVAFALSQLFVVSDIDYTLSNSQYAMCNYYDMLAEEAFGNFRTLLERVTLHAVMGSYLSMVRNEKANVALNIRPDENFAREVMQLFTIGLFELDAQGQVRTSNGRPIEAYDQRTVEQFAKTFTGWNYADTRSWDANHAYDRTLPMTAWPEYHDTTRKELLNGTVLPAGQTAEQDMQGALDNLFAHSNVGPFIATHLIRQLVTSNPTPGYIGRVAAAFDDDGNGTRGNMEAVVRAILTDTEARNGPETLPTTFGKVREPLIRMISLWRAFTADSGSRGVYSTPQRAIDQLDSLFLQGPMRAPSVFNFFPAGGRLGGGSTLFAPEKSILSESGLAAINNAFFNQIYDRNNRREEGLVDYWTVIDIDREYDLADDVDALIDHLEILLLGHPLPADFRSALETQVASHPTTPEGLTYRAMDAIYCIAASPFHLVQK